MHRQVFRPVQYPVHEKQEKQKVQMAQRQIKTTVCFFLTVFLSYQWQIQPTHR